MRFSVWTDTARSWDEIAATARFADAGDWYGVWVADHYMPNTADGAVADGDHHEAWAILGSLAAITERVRLGPLVSPTSVHHPALLAKRAATIDRVSGGRFVLGMGAGWQVNEHRAYGIELEPPGQRVTRFSEAIQIVRSLLTEDRTSFDGTVFTFTDAPANPKPVQSPLPILVGTGSPRMLRITARHADEWNTWGDVEMATARLQLFGEACEAVGRDRSTIRTSAQALIFHAADDEAAATMRERALPGRSLVGTTGELVEALGHYAELGFDEFIVPDFNVGSEQAKREDRLGRLWDEVLSHHVS